MAVVTTYAQRIVAIVGRSGAGKTTLIEALIPALKNRGLKVATIKHTHHSLNLHPPDSDSSKHRAAGADFTALSGPGQCSIEMNGEWTLNQVLMTVPVETDIVLLEGYKTCDFPKIEVVREPEDPSVLSEPAWIKVTSQEVNEVVAAILGANHQVG